MRILLVLAKHQLEAGQQHILPALLVSTAIFQTSEDPNTIQALI